MTIDQMAALVDRSQFASLGYMDEAGLLNIRRVFSTFHKGLGTHLISTNTSSAHVQSLLKNNGACLYFSDDSAFEGLCLSGKAVVHLDREYKEMMWHPQDVTYYPKGVEDEDYCVVEFIADSGRFYKGDAELYKGDLTKAEIDGYDVGKAFVDTRAEEN